MGESSNDRKAFLPRTPSKLRFSTRARFDETTFLAERMVTSKTTQGSSPQAPSQILDADMVAMPVRPARSELSLANRLGRGLWTLFWLVFCRFSPRPLHAWRRMWLRLFGAKIASSARIGASTRVWAPWNLEMHSCSTLADYVDCYNVNRVVLEEGAIVSQYSFLCTATHDITDPQHRLVTAPIRIGRRGWVCADVYVHLGVTLHEGAVAGARAVVIKDVPAWTIVAGNPAKPIKKRVMRQGGGSSEA